jgi:hypothetical protein
MVRTRSCLPLTARGELVEKIYDYIIQQGSVTNCEFQLFIHGNYNSLEVRDILTQLIDAKLIVRTLTGYATPPKPNKT